MANRRYRLTFDCYITDADGCGTLNDVAVTIWRKMQQMAARDGGSSDAIPGNITTESTNPNFDTDNAEEVERIFKQPRKPWE